MQHARVRHNIDYATVLIHLWIFLPNLYINHVNIPEQICVSHKEKGSYKVYGKINGFNATGAKLFQFKNEI